MVDKINKNFETSGKEKNESKIFDPVLELENIKQIEDHAERHEKIKEYKAKLTEQKERIATMQDLLINFIRQNPDIPLDELLQKLEKMGKNLNLADWQTEIGRKILTEYNRRHNLIKELKGQYPDEQELFYFLFGWKPEGKIEFVEGPITLSIICHGSRDYDKLHFTNGEYQIGEIEITKEGLKESTKSGGCHLHGLKEPYNDLVNILRTDVDNFDNLLNHEERHAIYSLFSEVFIKEINCLFFEKDSSLEENFGIIRKYVRERCSLEEDGAADEILAFLNESGWFPPEEIFELLIEPDGLYNFTDLSNIDLVKECYDELRGSLKLPPSEDLKRKIENIVTEIWVNDFQKHIQEGIRAFMLLKDLNFSNEETMAFLSIEPLAKWPKAVNRLIEQRQLKGKLN